MPWSKACPMPSSTQTLAPPGGSWHSWAAQPKQFSTRRTKNNPCSDLCCQWQIKG